MVACVGYIGLAALSWKMLESGPGSARIFPSGMDRPAESRISTTQRFYHHHQTNSSPLTIKSTFHQKSTRSRLLHLLLLITTTPRPPISPPCLPPNLCIKKCTLSSARARSSILAPSRAHTAASQSYLNCSSDISTCYLIEHHQITSPRRHRPLH